MAIEVAKVPHMSRTLGRNNAEDLVNERFGFMQQYVDHSFNNAADFLNALQEIFRRLNLPLPDVQVTEQNLFAATLAVQSVPFLAAALMLRIERRQRTDTVTSTMIAPAPGPEETALEEVAASGQTDAARAA